MKINVNYEDLFEQMKKVSAEQRQEGKPTFFNMGEMLDSLAFEPITGVVAYLAKRFSNTKRLDSSEFEDSTLMLLTKSDEIQALLEAAEKFPEVLNWIVPTWSINAEQAASKYEHGSASTRQRLEAARKVQEAGYRVRLRFDPMIPYDGWEKGYTDLVEMVYGEYGLDPEVTTLGSLRYEKNVVPIAKGRFPSTDLFDIPLEKGKQNKDRLPFELRRKMYQTVIEAIRERKPDQRIGFCKERDLTWVDLGFDTKETVAQVCNCATDWTFKEIWEIQKLAPREMVLPDHEIREIQLTEILDDQKHRYRKIDSVEGLKASIRANGVVNPIDVIQQEDETFLLVNGFRRVMAARALGFETIKARVFTELDEDQCRRLKAIENNSRKSWEPVEVFRFVGDCLDAEMTNGQIASLFDYEKRQIIKYRTVYQCEDSNIKESFANGEIKLGRAYLLAQAHKRKRTSASDSFSPTSRIVMVLENIARKRLGYDHPFQFKGRKEKGVVHLSIGGFTPDSIGSQLEQLQNMMVDPEVQELLEKANTNGSTDGEGNPQTTEDDAA